MPANQNIVETTVPSFVWLPHLTQEIKVSSRQFRASCTSFHLSLQIFHYLEESRKLLRSQTSPDASGATSAAGGSDGADDISPDLTPESEQEATGGRLGVDNKLVVYRAALRAMLELRNQAVREEEEMREMRERMREGGREGVKERTYEWRENGRARGKEREEKAENPSVRGNGGRRGRGMGGGWGSGAWRRRKEEGRGGGVMGERRIQRGDGVAWFYGFPASARPLQHYSSFWPLAFKVSCSHLSSH